MKKTVTRFIAVLLAVVMVFTFSGCRKDEGGNKTPTAAVTKEPLNEKPSEAPVETPTQTPAATSEPTPEATPEVTPEVTPEATPEPTPEVTPEVTPVVQIDDVPGVIPINTGIYYDSYWDEDKNERNGWYSCDYPKLATGYDLIYPELADMFDAFYLNRVETAEEWMQRIIEATGDDWDQECYRNENLTVTRSDTELICLSYYTDYYMGGAHGTCYSSSICIDPVTLEDVTLNDIIKDRDVFIDYVYDHVTLDADPSDFSDFDNIRKYIEESFDLGFLNFEVGYNYLAVIFNPYELKNLAYDQIFVDIPFKGNENLINDRYLRHPENYMVRMDKTRSVTTDLGDDGVINSVRIYGDIVNEYEDIGALVFYLNEQPVPKNFELEFDAYDLDCAYIHCDDRDYIYVTYWHDSDDDLTYIYRIDVPENGFDEEAFDNPYGDIIQVSDSGMEFDQKATYDPKYMTMSLRTDVMGTDFCTMHYAMGEDGDIHEVDDYYLFYGYFSEGGEITLKDDLTFVKLDAEGNPGEETVLPGGSKLKRFRTDLETYVDFIMGEETVRLPMMRKSDDDDENFWMYVTLDGEYLFRLFDGLSFAD
ncbi:MAG: hypothetical protein K6E62_08820 [Lachnospiraceae bacterium]|nr:hypothetical protein [Lachnospiraceae bacterium]